VLALFWTDFLLRRLRLLARGHKPADYSSREGKCAFTLNWRYFAAAGLRMSSIQRRLA
jgi:hypothetical protein